MNLSSQAQDIFDQISDPSTKSGDVKKLAKAIKKNHELGLDLWTTENFKCRQFATLIFDKALITQEFMDKIASDLDCQVEMERNYVMEWLMANQLMKSKKTLELILSWRNHPAPLLRRTYWYHQARLRWTGNTSHDNTEDLVNSIEKEMAGEVSEVQWAMNFTAGWIGVYDKTFRARCISLGEQLGLYSEEKAPKGCTPNYLPEFIRIEVGKRES